MPPERYTPFMAFLPALHYTSRVPLAFLVVGIVSIAQLSGGCSGAGSDTGTSACPESGIVASERVYGSLLEASEAYAGTGTISVCRGTFPGADILLTDMDIRVEGAGFAETLFDGANEGFVLIASVGGMLELSAMTLYGGVSRTDADGSGGFAAGLFVGTSAARLSEMEIRDNVADWGAGLTMPAAPADGGRPVVTVTNTRLVRNSSAWGGGAIALTGPGTITLNNVDLGSGPDDNEPDDIAFFDGPPDLETHTPIASYQFDGRVSVTCTWETRTCE